MQSTVWGSFREIMSVNNRMAGHSTHGPPNPCHPGFPELSYLPYDDLGWWNDYICLAELEHHQPIWFSGNFYTHICSFFYYCYYFLMTNFCWALPAAKESPQIRIAESPQTMIWCPNNLLRACSAAHTGLTSGIHDSCEIGFPLNVPWKHPCCAPSVQV